jgi:hypothetical protein
MLVGNKCDKEKARTISTSTAQHVSLRFSIFYTLKTCLGNVVYFSCDVSWNLKLADEYSMRYIETSGKANLNVEHAFNLLATMIQQRVGFASTNSKSTIALDERTEEVEKKSNKCC